MGSHEKSFKEDEICISAQTSDYAKIIVVVEKANASSSNFNISETKSDSILFTSFNFTLTLRLFECFAIHVL
jgi:hypothetical protein